MEEKRKFVRVPLVVKVTNKGTKEFHFFHSRDISIGGIFLETRDPYPMDTEVELDFFLPTKDHKDRIIVMGRVARVQPYDIMAKDAPLAGMGVEFKTAEAKHLAIIGNFIRESLGSE